MKRTKGFTLIESLITIVILGGFTYMIMATFNSIQIKNIQENSMIIKDIQEKHHQIFVLIASRKRKR